MGVSKFKCSSDKRDWKIGASNDILIGAKRLPITRGVPQGPAEAISFLLIWWPAPAATTKTLQAIGEDILRG